MSFAPWGDLLAAAAQMGIAPDAFWRTSVREWRLITAGVCADDAMRRAQLDELTLAYPDKGAGDGRKR